MKALVPYLNFNGNTEEVFNFYKTVFAGEFTTLQRFKDNPGADNIPAAEQNGIMHVALQIAPGYIIMGTDVPSIMPPVTAGTNMSLSVDTASEEEATSLFNALAEGGYIQMPLEKTFWGAFFGMVTDKFGIQWMVNFDEQK